MFTCVWESESFPSCVYATVSRQLHPSSHSHFLFWVLMSKFFTNVSHFEDATPQCRVSILEADDKKSYVDSQGSLIGSDAGCRQTLLSLETQCCCFLTGSCDCFYAHWRSSHINAFICCLGEKSSVMWKILIQVVLLGLFI